MNFVCRITFASLLALSPLTALARLAPPGVDTRLLNPRAIHQEGLQTAEVDSLTRGTYDGDLANLFLSEYYRLLIRYPEEWEDRVLMDQQDRITTVALFLSPLRNGDTAQENVNLVVEDLRGTQTHSDAYTTSAIEQVSEVFDNVQLLSSSDVLYAREFGHEISFSASYAGKDLLFDQVWIFHKGQAFVWTLASPPDTFPGYLTTFHHMLSSLVFFD